MAEASELARRSHGAATQTVETSKAGATTAAAALAHVKPGTIRVWAHRGRLSRAGTDTQALWDIREVLRCASRSGPNLTDDSL